eukprot:TRINITY_DN78636_c0_g1_i1.p1 TRINITY_DN78636_c0_g1~~TRINITY_DN78636_c0_g1_i1.p1  ORF type:complete len:591 (-),score=98.56 TRINITY_DN78636_c0_g1_i1:353-2125(-)
MAVPELEAALDVEWQQLRQCFETAAARQRQTLRSILQGSGGQPMQDERAEPHTLDAAFAAPQAPDSEPRERSNREILVEGESLQPPCTPPGILHDAWKPANAAHKASLAALGLPDASRTTTSTRRVPSLFQEPTEEIKEYFSQVLNVSGGPKPVRCVRNVLLSVYYWLNTVEEPDHTGCLARFVDGMFENICAGAIVLNVILMAVATNEQLANPGRPANEVVQGFELAFIVFYIFELSLKVFVHRLFYFVGENWGWNVFDTALVLFSAQDIVAMAMSTEQGSNVSFLRMLKTAKLAKVLRVARILHAFRELRVILQSLLGSLKSLVWSLIMMAFIYFMFALLFTQVTADYLSEQYSENKMTPDDQDWQNIMGTFGSVGTGMLTLFQGSFGADWTVPFGYVSRMGAGLQSCYIFFTAFINISLLNIVTGIFVESAMKLAQPENEQKALAEMRDQKENAEELRKIAEICEKDKDGYISPQEFAEFIRHPLLRAKLTVLGINIRDAEMFFSMLLAAGDGESSVPVDDFVKGCLRLQGAATSIDLQCLVFRVCMIQTSQSQFMEACTARLDLLARQIATLTNKSQKQTGVCNRP